MIANHGAAIYYEIMTFTTVGDGDIVPLSAQGKLLAICTALLGFTHGVTFVALLLQALTQHPSGSGSIGSRLYKTRNRTVLFASANIDDDRPLFCVLCRRDPDESPLMF